MERSAPLTTTGGKRNETYPDEAAIREVESAMVIIHDLACQILFLSGRLQAGPEEENADPSSRR